MKILLRYRPRDDLVLCQPRVVGRASSASKRCSGDGSIGESTEWNNKVGDSGKWSMLACDMWWKNVGSSCEEGKVGCQEPTREIIKSASDGTGRFGHVRFLQHIVPTSSPCVGREINISTQCVKGELCGHASKPHTVLFFLQGKVSRCHVVAKLSGSPTHPMK